MNKFLFLYIMLFFSLSLVSALEIDNVKLDRDTTFDGKRVVDDTLLQRYSPIEIKNAFGFGATLFEGYLSQHDYTCGVNCKSTIQVRLPSRGVLIDKLDFETLQRDGSWEIQDVRRYSIQYWGDVPDYIRECSIIGQTANRTNLYECTKVKSGSHRGWVDYNIGDEVAAGDYTIELKVKKSPSRTVDWVIETNGERLKSWATWGNISAGADAEVILNAPADLSSVLANPVTFNASLNITGGSSLVNFSLYTNESGIWQAQNISAPTVNSVNLTAYYGFDESNGISLPDEAVNGVGSDGVTINMNDSNWVQGLLINSLSFNGVDQQVNISGNSLAGIGAENLTVNVWVNTTNNTPFTLALQLGDDLVGVADSYISVGVVGGAARAQGHWTGGSEIILTGGTINNNQWHMITFTRRGGDNWTLYVDSVAVNSGIKSDVFTSLFDGADTFIGAQNREENFFEGRLDEFSFWNVSKNQTEINDLYNSGLGRKPGFTDFFTQTWQRTINEDIVWNVEGCDSDGDCGFSLANRTLLFNFIENSQTFSAITTEGNTETYSANITLATGLSVAVANFIYDGVSSLGTATIVNGDVILTIDNFIVPSVSADTNVSFFWSPILSNSAVINLTLQNQTILALSIDNCTVFTNQILNFSNLDEEFQTLLPNSTLEIAVNIFAADGVSQVLNLSGTFEQNPALVCINNILFNDTNYLMDVIVKYSADDHAIEYFNIVDFVLNNQTANQVISLFDLSLNESTEFQLTFKGTDFLPEENVLVFVERQYIAENVFKTVELPKTDANGQTVLHLVRNDIIYNLRFVKNGVTQAVFSNIIAFCQDFTIDNCFLDLSATTNVSAFENFGDVLGITFTSPPTFSSVTNLVAFSFSTVDGTSKLVEMNVERRDVFGNQSVCSNSVFSSSGSLFCDIGTGLTDTSLFTIITVDGQDIVFSTVIINESSFGDIGYAIWFILTMALILMAADSKNAIILVTLISYLGAIGLGWAVGGAIGLGSSGTWVIVITSAALWQINRRRES